MRGPLDALSWVLPGPLLEGPKHAVEVVADRGHGWVVGAKGRLPDRQRPLQLRPGALQVPKTLEHTAEVAACGGHVRVLGAKAGA